MLTGTLLPYQDPVCDAALARGRYLIAADMGTGKTVMAIAVAEELLGCGDVSRVLIVVPSSLKYQWAKSLAKFTDLPTREIKLDKQPVTVPAPPHCVVVDGKAYQRNRVKYTAADDRKRQYDSIGPETEYVIVSYESILDDSRMVRRIHPGLVILDECFIAGTPVMTPDGPVSIEALRPGDQVLNAAGTGTVMSVSVKRATRLLKFTMSDGRTFTTTPTHKLFTSEGFVVSSEIKKGAYLYGQQEALRILREGTPGDRYSRSGEEVHSSQQESVLQSVLFSELEDFPGILEGGIHHGSRGENKPEHFTVPIRTPGAVAGERRQDCRAAADAESGDPEEVVGNTAAHGTQAAISGGEWARPDSATGDSVGVAGSRVGSRIGSHNRGRVPASPLQDRPGAPGEDDCRGDRRAVTPRPRPEVAGHSETRVAGGAWVDSIQVLERGDSELAKLSGGTDTVAVYDLQVSGHPSYSVDGFLVHNCTQIKSFRAKRSKQIKRLLASEFRIGLTGTPIENGKPEELFSIMQWVDEDVLGRWDFYDQTYVRRDDNGMVQGYKNLNVLRERLAPAMARLSRHDPGVREYLPEVGEDQWNVPLEGPVRTAYMAMGRHLYAELKNLGHAGRKFSVSDYYGGQGDDGGKVGRVMAVHTAMEMLLDHPDLVVSSAMDYERTKKLPASQRKGSAYAYRVWQDGLLDEAWESPKLAELTERVGKLIDGGGKVLVFTKYRSMLGLIEEALGVPCVKYHGELSPSQKAAAIARYADPTGPRAFLSSHAGAYGCDMNMADNLANYDNPWQAGKADQINARHVRASSEFGKVYVHRMIVTGSIEERILGMQAMKRRVASAITDGRGADRYGRVENDVDSLTRFLEQTIEDLILPSNSSGEYPEG